MAVTAGAGPQTVRKDEGRRVPPQTRRRPASSFSLESRPVSFSAEKEMDLAPAAGSRTLAGKAPPGGTPPPAGNRPLAGCRSPQEPPGKGALSRARYSRASSGWVARWSPSPLRSSGEGPGRPPRGPCPRSRRFLPPGAGVALGGWASRTFWAAWAGASWPPLFFRRRRLRLWPEGSSFRRFSVSRLGWVSFRGASRRAVASMMWSEERGSGREKSP